MIARTIKIERMRAACWSYIYNKRSLDEIKTPRVRGQYLRIITDLHKGWYDNLLNGHKNARSKA